LRVKREHFVASAAGRNVSLIGLRSPYLCLRARGLAAQVSVIELQEQLAFANVVSFFHQQMLHRGGDGGVRFEILDGLGFAVGGDQAADGAALHRGSANIQRARLGEERDYGERGEQSQCPPDSALGRRGPSIRIIVGCCQPVIFQCAASAIASINLPL
jgi:hypothetical protein